MNNSQRLIFEQHIELLKLQIEEQNKREQTLKDLVNTLTQGIQYQRDIQLQNNKLTELNQKLVDGLKQAKIKHAEEIQLYDNEISKLKLQIHEKINDCERQRIQFQKKQLIFLQKINMLESIIQKKCGKINQMQKKIHDESILKLKQNREQNGFQRTSKVSDKNTDFGSDTLRVSHISSNYYDSENNMRASNISAVSKRSKQPEYMKLDKSQMKVIMGALLKSKRQIEKADAQLQYQNQVQQNKTLFQ